ncbi:hypothetical protein PybrP1_011204 [[Pythium] brassicae (nom. inval.)]|nr:hypothetical protein PybrP1_011204 [[Pythium] brassicae (nom. inval.)]
MEQYLLQVPKKLAQEVRRHMASGDAGKVEMISGADNKHFKLVVGGKEYASRIAQLPCILETHKTYDDNFFYKSGEIGQIFIVSDKEEELKALEEQEEVPNGITPPNTNVIKRKFEKTKRHTPFPKNDVARVEEDLVKIIQGGVIEDVHEELVDFYDWMVDSSHPNGLVVTDELELIRQHPEYLELSSEPPEKQAKLSLRPAASDAGVSAVNTPIVTDVGSEVESQAGQESAQLSPAFASPALSADDDKDVDDLEDDILGGMEVKPAQPARTSYQTDPAYLRLLPVRDKLLKSLRDAERDVNEYATKVSVSSNVVVMKRVKQLLETAQTQRDEIAAELEKTKQEIANFENS